MKYTLFLFAIIYLVSLATSQPLIGQSTTGQPASSAVSTPNDNMIHIYYGQSSVPTYYAIGDCITMEKNGQPLTRFQFPSTLICYPYTDTQCQQSTAPIPIPILPKIMAPYPFGGNKDFFKSYNCYEPKKDPFLKPLIDHHPSQ